MKNNPFISELEETKKRKKQHPSLSKGVQAFVRFHFDEIMEAKEELTWNEIADIFKKFNIVWSNGSSVSGKDLRSIVSRLKGSMSLKNEKIVSPSSSNLKPHNSNYNYKPSNNSDDEKYEPLKESSSNEVKKVGPNKKGNANLILEEMRRSTSERRS